MKPESTRKILVAGIGTSSAVLTETVWALVQGMWGFGIMRQRTRRL